MISFFFPLSFFPIMWKFSLVDKHESGFYSEICFGFHLSSTVILNIYMAGSIEFMTANCIIGSSMFKHNFSCKHEILTVFSAVSYLAVGYITFNHKG